MLRTPDGRLSAILAIAILLPSCGCIVDEDDGEDGFKDAVPPPPTGIALTLREGYQTGVGVWDANYSVTRAYPQRHYPVSQVLFQGVDRAGFRLDAGHMEYIDKDGDGFVSQGEHVLFRGLPEDINGKNVNITWNGSLLGTFILEWDTASPSDYLVRLGPMNGTRVGMATWNADMLVYPRPGGPPLACADLSFGFISAKGVVLLAASAQYIDEDVDGLVSQDDVLRLEGLTESYTGATLQVLVGDVLVGMKPLPPMSNLG